MKYSGFSTFRDLMTMWDEYLIKEDSDSKINALLDGGEFILFFIKDKDIYGADENSRVVFAKLKNPDDDLPNGWQEEASFSAQNLSQTVKGSGSQHVFGVNDLNKIKIIDRDEAFDSLQKQISDKDFSIDNVTTNKDQASNFIQTQEV